METIKVFANNGEGGVNEVELPASIFQDYFEALHLGLDGKFFKYEDTPENRDQCMYELKGLFL